MSESAATGDQDWFENVENFRPLRGGKRAGTLNEIATGTSKVTVEEAERRFLHKLANISLQPTGNDNDDPLDSMCQYVSWFEEHFPSGKQKYFYPILYKICTTFCTMDTYKNDERLLKLWLKLAENFPESGLAVMEFAFAKGSCRQSAKFYIFWSQMYQDIGWWNKAREKLQLGLTLCAVPISALHQASDELESCVMRMTCQSESEHADSHESEDFDESLETSREILGKLRGIGRRHFAPILRVPHGPTGKLAATKKREDKILDRFEVFTAEGSSQATTADNYQQTPVGTKLGTKRSRIAEQLVHDLYYQALFGTFDERVDLQITNEENALRPNELSSSKLPDIPAQTPLKRAFDIYNDEQQVAERKETKAKLNLRRELIKEMSIEEGFAKRLNYK